MAITKNVLLGSINVTQTGVVEVRHDTQYVEDGFVTSVSYHRHCIAPGQDYSQEDVKVQAICAAVHTPEVIAAYASAL